MKAGFAKMDITPRIGVELAGYGPFLNRKSIAVRDRLWARSMAFECSGKKAVIVSCDLIGVPLEITRRVRNIVGAATGIDAESIMLHCTHTHSGPGTGCYIGWGEADPSYLEILPGRIAGACIEAAANLQECTMSRGTAACEGVGYNRVYDEGHDRTQAVKDPFWRPARPELTDTACEVFMLYDSSGDLKGFASYFGCHPVVGGASSRYIHGDYCGVATNALERDHPGCTGLFLQGAQGDVNTCAVHLPDEQSSLLALDEIAGRYARAVRCAMESADPVEVNRISAALIEHRFQRVDIGAAKLEAMLAEKQDTLHAKGASDSDPEVRMAMVCAIALRRLAARAANGENMSPLTEIQAIAIGPLSLLAGPFEIFQDIKNQVVRRGISRFPLVIGITNDSQGYAVDGGDSPGHSYARDLVPVISGELPFADINTELCEKLLEVENLL